LTFPPNLNPNFGGILQAWALQQTIQKLGFPNAIGVARNKSSTFSFFKLNAYLFSHLLTKRAAPRTSKKLLHRAKLGLMLRFASKNMITAKVFASDGSVNSKLTSKFNNFVVGSDQIWRPDYANIRTFLLDFTRNRRNITRIAYAASFGRNPYLYQELAQKEMSALAQSFDAISVREKSSINFVHSVWGSEAVSLVDPTMLLYREDYLPIMKTTTHSSTSLFSYILDSTPEKEEGVIFLRDSLEPVLDSSRKENPIDNPATVAKLIWSDKSNIHTWLDSLAGADFVVTDSFHGCAFSIIFNKPFAVFINEERGKERFDSLLQTFGLESRVIDSSNNYSQLVHEPIDWAAVNSIREEQRLKGLSFLMKHLAK
jgi:hypothetical protein